MNTSDNTNAIYNNEEILELILSFRLLSTQEESLKALVKIGTPAVEPLIASLNNKNKRVIEFAAKALGKIRDPRAIEPLIDAMIEYSYLVEDVVEKFGELSVEPLIAVLNDKNSENRENAAKVLGEIKDIRAINPLISSLGDSELENSVSWALNCIGKSAIKPLIVALQNEDAQVRKNAASVLGLIGNNKALKALKTMLKDNEEDVRENASEAIDHIIAISSSWFVFLKDQDLRNDVFNYFKNMIFRNKLIALCDLCGIESMTLSDVYTYNAQGVPSSVEFVGKLVCKECYMKVASNDPELTLNADKAHKIAKKYMKLHKEDFLDY